MLGIPAAFSSRVSNRSVFDRANVQPLSEQILFRQLVLLGKIARAPPDSLLRRCVFIDDSLLPQVGRFVRRVGRPRLDWTTEVMKAGAIKFGGTTIFEELLKSREPDAAEVWLAELQRVFNGSPRT